MVRQVKKYPVPDVKSFLRNLLFYGSNTEIFCLLNSNRSANLPLDKYRSYDSLAGIGSIDELKIETDPFNSMQKFYDENRDWLFGFLTYDLKNELNKLSSSNFDGLDFPSVHFFCPRYVIALRGHECEILFNPQHNDESSTDKLFNEIIIKYRRGQLCRLLNKNFFSHFFLGLKKKINV